MLNLLNWDPSNTTFRAGPPGATRGAMICYWLLGAFIVEKMFISVWWLDLGLFIPSMAAIHFLIFLNGPPEIRFSRTMVNIPRHRGEQPLIVLYKDLIGAKQSKGQADTDIVRVFHRTGSHDIPLYFLAQTVEAELIKVFNEKAELKLTEQELQKRDADITAALSRTTLYRYGVNTIVLWLAVAVCSFAVWAGTRMTDEGHPLGTMLTVGSALFLVLGVAGLFLSRKPRYFTFNEHSVTIPYSIIPPREVVVAYTDLLDVVHVESSKAPMLRVIHRSGKTDIPYHVLAYVNSEELRKAFLSRRVSKTPVAVEPQSPPHLLNL